MTSGFCANEKKSVSKSYGHGLYAENERRKRGKKREVNECILMAVNWKVEDMLIC